MPNEFCVPKHLLEFTVGIFVVATSLTIAMFFHLIKNREKGN